MITTDLNVGRGILGGLVPDPRPAGSDLEEDWLVGQPSVPERARYLTTRYGMSHCKVTLRRWCSMTLH